MALEFDDGTKASGNMAIGCDGSHSRVREFLVGPELARPVETGHTLINYAASGYTREQALKLREYHPILKLGFHPTNGATALLAGMQCDII